jgi:hypothetical protein
MYYDEMIDRRGIHLDLQKYTGAAVSTAEVKYRKPNDVA